MNSKSRMFPPVVRGVIVNPEWKILMVRHRESDQWVFPGGHVESHESLHEALLREIDEELWLTCSFEPSQYEEPLTQSEWLTMIPLPITGYTLSYERNGQDLSRTEYIFVLETREDIEHQQKSEIHEYGWFDPDDIASGKTKTFPMNMRIIEKLFFDE